MIFLFCTLFAKAIETYEVYFPPKQKCLPRIVQILQGAKSCIYVQCYGFTQKIISQQLVQAKLRGVKIVVIADKSQLTARGSCIAFLRAQNIPVYIDHKVAIAHNKVIIVDKRTLLTGSYNFTNSAESRNAENLLIIQNNNKLIQAYMKNFTDRLKASKKLG